MGNMQPGLKKCPDDCKGGSSMKVYRIASALFFLLPLAWDGMVDAGNPQQTTLSQIVFLVH
jgi:hypothetical protein